MSIIKYTYLYFIKEFYGACPSNQPINFVLPNNHILMAIFKGNQQQQQQRGTQGKKKYKTINENKRQNQ